MKTFEELFLLVRGLPMPAREDQRTVEWCDPRGVVGLAREAAGGYEVFIAGDRLQPRQQLVRKHLRHDRWRAEEKGDFSANRIVFPSDPHFEAMSAFLVEELLRNGVVNSPHAAFEATEPLIEMALRGTALSEEAVLGLLGEHCVMEWLLQAAKSERGRAACINAWRGYEPSTRDFAFEDAVGLEVKVTRGVHSRHRISSIAQVDPRRSPDGDPLEHLWLVSLGVSTVEDESSMPGITLPEKVDSILHLLGPSATSGKRNAIQALFLDYVCRYAGGSGASYVHDEMRTWEAYNGEWCLRFVRAYHMNDDEMSVLTLADVERRHFILSESVSFTVDLPDVVGTSGNPRSDMSAFAVELLGSAA